MCRLSICFQPLGPPFPRVCETGCAWQMILGRYLCWEGQSCLGCLPLACLTLVQSWFRDPHLVSGDWSCPLLPSELHGLGLPLPPEEWLPGLALVSGTALGSLLAWKVSGSALGVLWLALPVSGTALGTLYLAWKVSGSALGVLWLALQVSGTAPGTLWLAWKVSGSALGVLWLALPVSGTALGTLSLAWKVSGSALGVLRVALPVSGIALGTLWHGSALGVRWLALPVSVALGTLGLASEDSQLSRAIGPSRFACPGRNRAVDRGARGIYFP